MRRYPIECSIRCGNCFASTRPVIASQALPRDRLAREARSAGWSFANEAWRCDLCTAMSRADEEARDG